MTVGQLNPRLDHPRRYHKDRAVLHVRVRDSVPWLPRPGEWQALDVNVNMESAIAETMLGVGYFQTGTVWVCMEQEL